MELVWFKLFLGCVARNRHNSKEILTFAEKNKMIDFITFCDYTGTFAFAISGIRLASAKQFDWFGAYVVGLVTAVGGGTRYPAERDSFLDGADFLFNSFGSRLIICYHLPEICDPAE